MIIYLYVKEHSITRLKYFGRTTSKYPHKYLGSGIYWKKHIQTHGKEFVNTINIWEFENQEECTKFALEFSKENNIVESKEWANLEIEDGLNGSATRSAKTKIKISKSHKTRLPPSEETKLKISQTMKGRPSYKKGIPLSEKARINITLAAQRRCKKVEKS